MHNAVIEIKQSTGNMSDSEKKKTNDVYSNVDLEHEATKITCDVLCSLIASTGTDGRSNENGSMDSDRSTEASGACKTKQSKRSCPKQLQLPLFLSSKSGCH